MIVLLTPIINEQHPDQPIIRMNNADKLELFTHKRLVDGKFSEFSTVYCIHVSSGYSYVNVEVDEDTYNEIVESLQDENVEPFSYLSFKYIKQL